MKNTRESWIEFYKQFFGFELNFYGLGVGEKDGCWVPIPQGLSLMSVARAFSDKTRSYEISPHLEETITENIRQSNKTYQVFVMSEACFHNKEAALYIDSTLLEGLIFQLKHFFDKQKFSPYKKIVCNGTICLGDKVPVIVNKKGKISVEFK